MAVCPHCSHPFEPDLVQGLCPACLLREGLAEDTAGASGTHPFDLPSSEELGRRFPQLEIIEFVGRGGMGAVYKARQKSLERVVALKVLPLDIGRDAAFAERFTREAKALAKLNHPNIVTLYEFGQAEGCFFLLMEFVDGVNLRQLLETERMTSREALAMVPQVCDALQYAHDQGVVHRDIKPANILLDRRGHVKIADFGLARLRGKQEADARTASASAEEGTRTGQVLGTPRYMAPEQSVRPGAVDHRADIYSLGVVIYQMLTGELPEEEWAPPSTKVQIDVRLDDVVLRALQRDPQRRYQHVSDVRTELATITETPRDAAGILRGPGNERPRHWKLSIGLIAILLVSIIGVAVYAYLPNSQSPVTLPGTTPSSVRPSVTTATSGESPGATSEKVKPAPARPVSEPRQDEAKMPAHLPSLDQTMQPETADRKAFPSPYDVACSPDGDQVFVSFYTSLELGVVDATTGKVLSRIGLKGRPAGLTVSPDGTRVYVACASPDGQVMIGDTRRCEVIGAVAVGHTPTDLALSGNGKQLFCCNRFSNTVSVIDVAARKETRRFAVAREPVACVVTLDGKTLLVAHHLPLGPATEDHVGAAVSAVDLASGQTKSIDLPNGSTGVRGICLSPDGTYAYLTHSLARFQLPFTQIERGWVNTNALSIVKVADLSLFNTVLLDDENLGAANPWGVTCSRDGRSLYVTHAGTNELSIIDRTALHERLDLVADGKKVATSSKPAEVPCDLHFLKGVRRRVAMAGKGPRGVGVHKGKIWVAEYFSDSLSVVDTTKATPPVKHYQLGTAEMDLVRRGEMIFNDATNCLQRWHSCATCHPDARSDGLNWDLLRDGIGNSKNTRSLVLANKMPSVMRLEEGRSNTNKRIQHNFKHVYFTPKEERQVKAVEAYLKSLRPVRSPLLTSGALSDSAKRGMKVFEKARCYTCHEPPFYNNRASYKLDYAKGQDSERTFETRTLVEVWRTGPYLYDGRATTIEEALQYHIRKDQRDGPSKLTAEELKDLAEYVRSL